MSASRKRPTGPPPSAGVLARYAQAYARELGVAEGRVRAWVAYMIMAGVLERVTNADSPLFIVKGGVALELRLRDRAGRRGTGAVFRGRPRAEIGRRSLIARVRKAAAPATPADGKGE